MLVDTTTNVTILIGGYLLLLGTSGIILNYILSKISKEPIDHKISKEVHDTGFVVGKCEKFAAKAIVRREDMSRNSLFFLAGTMINTTYSVIMGVIIKILISVMQAGI